MKFLTTDIENIDWVSHGFFTRAGGVSGGIYGSLNCALTSNDAPGHVRANRAKVAEALGLDPGGIVTLKQVHSARAMHVTKVLSREETPEADALVTDQPGIGIAVLTADCAPVLFAAKDARVVGAAHAGWKGAVTGILEATVAAMGELGVAPANIVAAIGPCIGPQSYEVSEGFEKPFLAQDAANARFFSPAAKPGHIMFDLPGYTAARLSRLGVGAVIDVRQDTLANEDAFFSYRRACLNKEPDYGRQISVIAIRP